MNAAGATDKNVIPRSEEDAAAREPSSSSSSLKKAEDQLVNGSGVVRVRWATRNEVAAGR